MRNMEIMKTWKMSKTKSQRKRDQVLVPSLLPTLFKVEAKLDIKPYQDESDVVKLNQWLYYLEVYFGVHNRGEDPNILFV
jgi:hypothetical protein